MGVQVWRMRSLDNESLQTAAVSHVDALPAPETPPAPCTLLCSMTTSWDGAEQQTSRAASTRGRTLSIAWTVWQTLVPAEDAEWFGIGPRWEGSEPAPNKTGEQGPCETMQPAVDDAEDVDDDGQEVTAYFFQYRSPLGMLLFLPESVDAESAGEISDSFAKLGMSPMVYRLSSMLSEPCLLPNDAPMPTERKDQQATAEGMENIEPAEANYLSIRDIRISISLAAEDRQPAGVGYSPAIAGLNDSDQKDTAGEQSQAQALEAYYVQYSTPAGKRVFLPEACDLQITMAICRQLSQSGKAPLAFKTTVAGPELLESTANVMTLPDLEAAEYGRWGDDVDDDQADDVGSIDIRSPDAVPIGRVLSCKSLHPESHLQPAANCLNAFQYNVSLSGKAGVLVDSLQADGSRGRDDPESDNANFDTGQFEDSPQAGNTLIAIHAVSYDLPDGRKVWWKECLQQELSEALARQF